MTARKMTELSLSAGDYVELGGNYNRQTTRMVRPDTTLASDDAVRLSTYTKITLRVKNGDLISIRPYQNIKFADEVKIVAFEDTLDGTSGVDVYEEYIRPFFGAKFRPLTKNDVFRIRGRSATIEFKVLSTNPSPSAVVIGKTAIDFQGQPIAGRVQDAAINDIGLKDVGGYVKEIITLRNLVEYPLRYPEIYDTTGIKTPRCILICGPRGVGKSLLAHAISNETDALRLPIECKLFENDQDEAEKSLRNAFRKAEVNSPAIIVFEDIDAITPHGNQAQGATATCIVGKTLNYVDGSKWMPGLMMLATTSNLNDVDPAFLKCGRFDSEVVLGVPDVHDRLEILKVHARKMRLSSDVNLQTVAGETNGFVGSELKSICDKAGRLHIQEKTAGIDMKNEALRRQLVASVAVSMANFQSALKSVKPSFDVRFEYPNITWTDVVIAEEVKKQLQEIFIEPVTYSSQYNTLGLTRPKGILIMGPPGCSKTLLARASAGECHLPLLFVKGPEILSSRFGESEGNVKALFAQAEDAAPCFLVFDEMDSIGRARGTNQDSEAAMGRVVAQLLTSIDASKDVVIIGITNLPEVIDGALLRPNRLDNFIYVALPDEVTRFEIFKKFVQKMPHSKDVEMGQLAKNTNGFSGADIKSVCEKASKAALRDFIRFKEEQKEKNVTEEENKSDVEPGLLVTMNHFQEVLKTARPSVSDSELQRYTKFLSERKGNQGSNTPSSEKSGGMDSE